MKHIVPVTLLLALATCSWAAPTEVDLHDYWDQRCSNCHGHSGEFARQFLRVKNGRLQGVHHRDDLSAFLANHYLNQQLIAPVTAMLRAQLTTPPLFNQKCAGCHDSAAAFARNSLGIVNGVLVGTSSGRRVVDYLKFHGKLELSEVPIIVDTLRRVRDEVTTPNQ